MRRIAAVIATATALLMFSPMVAHATGTTDDYERLQTNEPADVAAYVASTTHLVAYVQVKMADPTPTHFGTGGRPDAFNYVDMDGNPLPNIGIYYSYIPDNLVAGQTFNAAEPEMIVTQEHAEQAAVRATVTPATPATFWIRVITKHDPAGTNPTGTTRVTFTHADGTTEDQLIGLGDGCLWVIDGTTSGVAADVDG